MSPSLPLSPLSVLLVDDEPRSLETLRRTIDEHFNVLTADSAQSAYAVMASEPVQIVVSDQRMPGTTGVDFLRQVRAQWPNTVRLILSGYEHRSFKRPPQRPRRARGRPGPACVGLGCLASVPARSRCADSVGP